MPSTFYLHLFPPALGIPQHFRTQTDKEHLTSTSDKEDGVKVTGVELHHALPQVYGFVDGFLLVDACATEGSRAKPKGFLGR